MKMTNFPWILSTSALGLGIISAAETTLLVEAEGFEDTGGWVISQQVMDQMGSPCLLAYQDGGTSDIQG